MLRLFICVFMMCVCVSECVCVCVYVCVFVQDRSLSISWSEWFYCDSAKRSGSEASGNSSSEWIVTLVARFRRPSH